MFPPHRINPVMFDTTCTSPSDLRKLTKASHPPTSHAAGKKVGPKMAKHLREFHAFMRGLNKTPCTADGLHYEQRWEGCLGLSPSRVRTVICHLVRAGKVRVVGIGKSDLGNPARTFKAVR